MYISATGCLDNFFRALYLAPLCLLLLAVPTLDSQTTDNGESENERRSFAQFEPAINFMQTLAKQKSYNLDFLLAILDEVHFDKEKENIVSQVKRPVEQVLTWGSYQKRFLTKKQINGGVEFWNKHNSKLQRALKEFGIPPEIIVATIGVESFYGKNTGSYRVIDSLVTLSFMGNHRNQFYKNQLTYFIELAERNQWSLTTIASLHGSYSGAIGPAQFIPGSIIYYAIDWNADDTIDMTGNFDDIIGSIANYYYKARWKPGEPIMERLASLPKQTTAQSIVTVTGANGIEHWRTYPNYKAILRYNNSDLYALTIYHLSKTIVQERNNTNSIE